MKVFVEEHGDIISVCDEAANGHSAWVEVSVPVVSDTYRSTVTNGFGSCVTHQASNGGKFDLAEFAQVVLVFDGNGGSTATAQFFNDH